MSADRNASLIYSIGEKIQEMGMVTEIKLAPNNEIFLEVTSKETAEIPNGTRSPIFWLSFSVQDGPEPIHIQWCEMPFCSEAHAIFDLDTELFEASQFVTGLIRGLVHNE